MPQNLQGDSADIRWFEKNFMAYRYAASAGLIFENDRSLAQECFIFPGSKIACDWWRKEQDYSIQVVFPLVTNWDYNNYFILIYDWVQEVLFLLGYRSHTVYPPVWDRSFSPGPDYIDFVNIQRYINKFLKSRNMKEFEIDTDLVGKSWNATLETPEEVRRLLKEGKPYQIVSLKAEAVPDKVRLVSLTKQN